MIPSHSFALISLISFVISSANAAPYFKTERISPEIARRDGNSWDTALPSMQSVCQETQGCSIGSDGSLQFSQVPKVNVLSVNTGNSTGNSSSLQTTFGVDNAMLPTGLCNTVDMLDATLTHGCNDNDLACLGTWQTSCSYKDSRGGRTDPDVGQCSMTVDVEYPNDPTNTLAVYKALGKQLIQSLFDDSNSGAQYSVANPTDPNSNLTSYAAPTRMQVITRYQNDDGIWSRVGYLKVGISCEKNPPPSNLACEILKGVFGGLLDIVSAGLGEVVTSTVGKLVLAGASSTAGQGSDQLC